MLSNILRRSLPRALPLSLPLRSSARFFTIDKPKEIILEPEQAVHELLSTLEEEIEFESKTPALAMSMDLLKSESESGRRWELFREKGKDECVLVRNLKDEHIRVSFRLTDPRTVEHLFDEDGNKVDHNSDEGKLSRMEMNRFSKMEEDEEEDGDDYVEDEDMHGEESMPAQIEVSITKPKQPELGAITALYTLDESAFNLVDVSLLPSVDLLQQTTEAEWQKRTIYTGPDFSDLDPALQDDLAQYFRSRGIDRGLSEYITEIGAKMEHEEYVDWLGKLENFVKTDSKEQ